MRQVKQREVALHLPAERTHKAKNSLTESGGFASLHQGSALIDAASASLHSAAARLSADDQQYRGEALERAKVSSLEDRQMNQHFQRLTGDMKSLDRALMQQNLKAGPGPSGADVCSEIADKDVKRGKCEKRSGNS